MELMIPPGRLDRPVDHETDHVLGPADAEITLVEYGSYACPHCRAANERIAQARDQLGDRVCYAFRHRPLTDNSLSFRAAELAELAQTPEAFWSAHIKLMTRSMQLTEDDLVAVAADLGVNANFALGDSDAVRRARARVEADVASSRASGVRFTPTFYINRRRYDGPWDESSLVDAMLGTLGHRVRTAALDFASWGPSAGILLILATVAAIVLTNSPIGPAFEALWRQELGVSLGDAAFRMSILHWVNDGLLTVFFLVVGLEVKREMTVGHLASRRSAALPIAAALGGMVVPALLYALVIPAGPWSHGWGVPMATDTAFAIALIAVMGARVPVELRIFLTAAAIVDDIGAIVVVAVFYSGDIHPGYLAAAAAVVVALALLSRSRVYLLSPYILLGIALWAFVYAGGLHATLAGVVLALFIPTRPPADLAALMTQASTIIASEARHEGEVLRHGPSTPALHALDAIYDRLEFARRPAAAARRRAVELRCPPDLRTGECGRGDQPGRLRWAWLAHGRDRRWPRHRKAARRLPRGCRGRARRHSRQAGGVHVAAVGRGGSPRWHRLHDVAFYRRAGVSKRHRLLGRQDRRVRRVDSFGRRRDCSALGSFAPGAYRRGAAERQHASIIARRRLCGIVNRRSFDDSTYRYDSSSR